MDAPSHDIAVVNQRMSAYNAHDFDAFLTTYAPCVVFYRYPDEELGRGHAHLERLFRELFEQRAVHVQITNQIDRPPFVVNDECVRYGRGNRIREVRYVSIYEVQGGQIVSVRFVGR